MKRFLWAFVSGFIAVLVFHQAMLSILHGAGFTTYAPFPMQPTKPFAMPQVWSLAFWGGVWGFVFAIFFRASSKGAAYWLGSILFGALGPTLVAWLVVAPLKGQSLSLSWTRMVTGLLVNGAWGFGTALFLRVLSKK